MRILNGFFAMIWFLLGILYVFTDFHPQKLTITIAFMLASISFLKSWEL